MENWTTDTVTSLPQEDEENRQGIFWAGLISILVFYVAVLAVGTLASYIKKAHKGTSEDMMLAGRDIGFVVGIFTMTSTWVGGGYINGTAEHIAQPGFRLAWCQAPFAYSLSLILGGLFYAKKMREAEYATILDPFQAKYGAVMTTFLYIPCLVGDVVWSAAVLSALGSSLTVVIGISHEYAVITSGGIAVLYTLVGGLYSVSFTDVIQLVCMFFGLYLVLPFAMTHDAVTPIKYTAGGSDGWIGTLEWNNSMGLWLDRACQLLGGGIPWQVYYQRVLSQRSAKRAQYLSYIASFGCLVMTVPPLMIGAVASSTNWNQTDYPKGIEEDYSLALPLVMRYLTPTAVGVIGLGAVSAAVMSSADSCILSSSSMFARNVYQPLRNRLTVGCKQWNKMIRASDTEVIWVMRFAIVVIGVAACGMAIVVTSIYDLFLLCADFPYVILLPQLTCILHVSFVNTYGSAIGFALGLFFRLSGGEAAFNFPALIHYPMYEEDTGIQNFPFKTMAMLLNLLGIIVGSWIARALFTRNILPRKADIFMCFEEDTEDTNIKLATEIEMKSREAKA